jgi:hypothetical protein
MSRIYEVFVENGEEMRDGRETLLSGGPGLAEDA